MMNIGILGSGNVAQALGRGFAHLGHEVMLSSRIPEQGKLANWLKDIGKKGSYETFADTATFGEVIILAVRWSGVENAIQLAGIEHFKGKLVIDCTNPLRFAANQAPTLDLGHSDSAGESIQRWLPDARVVKAFNTIGSPHMVNPVFPDGPPTTFICGNDAAAKELVTRFLYDFGWGVVDSGDITASRYLEPLAMLWILYAIHTGSSDHAFKLLRK
ncbi:MAG: DNA-binding protein [Candidatus Marinimicrobia bacterium CG_4_10_14_0_2_um_filter_48_9]|nr:MAG: DNA-binding protein [Candidatus Marinimicrobia bacterium CG_4_10_14_0_2_um_filter_48_9]